MNPAPPVTRIFMCDGCFLSGNQPASLARGPIGRLARVQIRELSIPDAYSSRPRQHSATTAACSSSGTGFDGRSRGRRAPPRPGAGETSVSRRGSVRGIHFADIPPGQAKYVTAPQGAVLDFVVDIRVGSPTFGAWDPCCSTTTTARHLPRRGLGHGFVALDRRRDGQLPRDRRVPPDREHGIHPMDPELGLESRPRPASSLLRRRTRTRRASPRPREPGCCPPGTARPVPSTRPDGP